MSKKNKRTGLIRKITHDIENGRTHTGMLRAVIIPTGKKKKRRGR